MRNVAPPLPNNTEPLKSSTFSNCCFFPPLPLFRDVCCAKGYFVLFLICRCVKAFCLLVTTTLS